MPTIQTRQGITNSDLECLNTVKSGDIILFYTGTSPKMDSKDIRNNYKKEYEKFEGNFTYLELSAAEWIVGHNIKCVGIDNGV